MLMKIIKRCILFNAVISERLSDIGSTKSKIFKAFRNKSPDNFAKWPLHECVFVLNKSIRV
jgi:hypothetical protein